MEGKDFKEKESLELISQVLSEHRARLSDKNSDLLWMTGMASVLLCIGMMVLTRWLPDRQVMWFTFLIPASALLIARHYRERRVKTFLDEMFHSAWMYMWLFPALLSMVYLFTFEANYNLVFLLYIVALMVGLLILLEVVLKMRYASACVIGSGSMGYLFITSMEESVFCGLLSFLIFCLFGLLLSGGALQWQVKHRIKNPIK